MGFPRLAEHPRIPQQGNEMVELAVVTFSFAISRVVFLAPVKSSRI